jgi:signal transduction histidine kinase
LCTPVLAQTGDPSPREPLILTDQQGEYPLGLHLEILEDPSGELTIERVSSPEFETRFVPSQAETPNYGFTSSAIWVQIRLHNETLRTDQWVLEQGFTNMHYVDLYTPEPNGRGYTVIRGGVLRPSTTRDLSYPHIVFRLVIPPGSEQIYYLRFQNGASMTLPLTLWTQPAFINHSVVDQLSIGIFYGVLIGLLFYNLFLLFSVREASYFYFVLLLASLIVEEVSSDGYWSLFITNPVSLITYIIPWTTSLLIAAIVLFSDSFLELKTRIPILHRLSMVLVAIWGVMILIIPITSYHTVAIPGVSLGLLSLFVVIIAGILSWRRKFLPARFFVIAWFGMLIGIIWVFLIRLVLVPSTLLGENAYRLGSVWLVLCWSFALADRINLLKAATENAYRDLRSNEHRLSEILEGLPLGVVLYGKDQKPKYTNRRAIDILSNPEKGIQPDLAAERTLEQALRYYSMEVADSHQGYPLENFPVIKALQGDTASADDVEMEQGDRRIPLEIWASPVRDDAGNVEAAVVAFQDITQRKQTEAELDKYRIHLESLVEDRTIELNAVNEQIRMRLEWLSVVHRIHQTITGEASLPTAYEELSDKILQLLDAKIVFILRWKIRGEQSQVYCRFQQDDCTHDIKILQAAFQPGSLLRRDIDMGKIICWSRDQATALPAPFVEFCLENDFDSLILAPLTIRQSVTGVLCVAVSKPLQDFIKLEVDLVEKMAFDLANLDHDATLLDRALALATTDERNRMARDLHDSVTQVLFSITLLAEVLPQIWRLDPEQGLQKLDKLRQLARGALAEMRTMLLELRPSAVVNFPLAELLTQLIDATVSRSGLPIQFNFNQIPPLPEPVHTSFYRIAQEALNNVVKHAQANQVEVRLSATLLTPDPASGARHEVKLVIRDDGVGYYSGERMEDHLGIGIMQERAADIQGNLTLESKPGYGTQVTLVWCGETERRP